MPNPSPSRRQVLAAAAIAGVVPLFTQAAAPQSRPSAVSPALARAKRWFQLALVEKDPETFDPDWWLNFFKEAKVDGACISAGGMCAYYPTQIPNHHRSEFLGEKDTFGYLVQGCRKLGMSILARVDPHCIRDEDAQAHPDWVAVNAQGNKVRHTVITDRWFTCGLGPVNFEFIPKVIAEIAGKYDIDGFYANRWQPQVTCFCVNCLRNFKAATGLDAPANQNARGAAEWAKWRTDRLMDVWDTWQASVDKVKGAPGVWCLMNYGGANNADMPKVVERAAMIAADRQGRSGSVTPPGVAGWNAKIFRSVMGDKPVAGIASLGFDDNHRWKDSVQSPAETRMWVIECMAAGMRPWVVKFSGTLYDKRWVPAVRELYQWHAANERFLNYRRNLARVGVVWSPQTASAIGNARAEAHQMGICHALIEARIPFEMVSENFLDAAHLARLKMLILPGTAALSDAQCGQIRQFAAAGGGLLATYETSLYDETGRARGNFGLADLFGVRYAGRTQATVKNSYLTLEHDTNHPILKGFDRDTRPINSVGYADVTAVAQFDKPPLMRVPSYPDLPMEDVWPRQVHSDIPDVFARSFRPAGLPPDVGNSRVAYFPGDIDRTFNEILDPDHGRILANTVRWALNEPDVVEVEGSGILDVNVWETADGVSVHLVNLTNPMMMRGPIREAVKVGPFQLRLRLPPGKAAREVRLLVKGEEVKPEMTGGVMSLTVPEIREHEVVGVVF